MRKYVKLFLVLFFIVSVLLYGCSNIQNAIESKQKKCEKERAHCKADCGALSDVFGCKIERLARSDLNPIVLCKGKAPFPLKN